jgi:hypothetical protein
VVSGKGFPVQLLRRADSIDWREIRGRWKHHQQVLRMHEEKAQQRPSPMRVAWI